jgi:hypothetical protein
MKLATVEGSMYCVLWIAEEKSVIAVRRKFPAQ